MMFRIGKNGALEYCIMMWKKEGCNLITKDTVKTMRRELVTEWSLPIGAEYQNWVSKILEESFQK